MTRQVSLFAAAASVFMAACSHTPETAPSQTVEAPLPPVEEAEPVVVEEEVQPDLSERERAQLAIKLLDAGMVDEAEVEIATLLDQNPKNSVALKLRNQIETDPVELLGADHKTYTVKPGETLGTLAKSHLGDPLLFYALSRYNGMEAPNKLMAGQVLKMPGLAVEVEPAQEVADAPEAEDAVDAVETEMAEEAPSGNEVALARLAAPTDVVTANALRLQALQELNAGNAERATSLLRRAHDLDKDNLNIAADLAKAERIAAAVKQHN